MKLEDVSIRNYKRLMNVRFTTKGKLTALVGPNEAGKSSILTALATFSAPEAAPQKAWSRGAQAVSGESPFLSLTYRLDESDTQSLRRLNLAHAPRRMTVHKTLDGSRTYDLSPPPVRGNQRSAAAAVVLQSCSTWSTDRLAQLAAERDSGSEEAEAQLAEVKAQIADPLADALEAASNDDKNFNGPVLMQTLQVATERGWQPPADYSQTISAWLDELSRDPKEDAFGVLNQRIPEVLFFDSEARDLRPAYDLDQIAGNPDSAPRALVNLLTLADASLDEVLLRRDDITRRLTMFEHANATLEAVFKEGWNQSKVSAFLNLNGSQLEVAVRDRDDDTVVAFDERSDGLRMFIALTAFLGKRRSGPSAILLIDEAEQHLHYNAQADLINVLISDLVVSKVIYTTHSPGCLPRDLGTGVRFVSPLKDGHEQSEVRHDFWSALDSNRAIGFDPLLFVMGAGAAAFASLRHAVLAEGASDMLLLPSIMRTAIRAEELPYQVAPGISSIADPAMSELRLTATSVCYVLDGDQGGATLRNKLTSMGVSPDLVLQLPANMAVEDLVDETCYLTAVAQVLNLAGPEAIELAAGSEPIKNRVKAWCAANGRTASAIAVAEQILSPDFEIVVKPDVIDALAALHESFLAALGLKEVEGS